MVVINLRQQCSREQYSYKTIIFVDCAFEIRLNLARKISNVNLKHIFEWFTISKRSFCGDFITW